MTGSEGGIPFHTPPRPRIYHAPTTAAAPRPLCGVQSFTVFTVHDPEQVTCPDCRRLRGPA